MEPALLSRCPAGVVGLQWGPISFHGAPGEGPAVALPALRPFLGSPSPWGLRIGPFHCSTRSPLPARAAVCAGNCGTLQGAWPGPPLGVPVCLGTSQCWGHPSPSSQGSPHGCCSTTGPAPALGAAVHPPGGESRAGGGGAVGSHQSPWGPSLEPPSPRAAPSPAMHSPGYPFAGCPVLCRMV